MSKGPLVCNRFLEEFGDDRNIKDFKCMLCGEHPDWHNRDPNSQPGKEYNNYYTSTPHACIYLSFFLVRSFCIVLFLFLFFLSINCFIYSKIVSCHCILIS